MPRVQEIDRRLFSQLSFFPLIQLRVNRDTTVITAMPSNNRSSILSSAISYLPQPFSIPTAINKRLTIFRDSIFPPDPATAAQIKQIQEKLSYDEVLQRNAAAVAELRALTKPPAVADRGSLYSSHTISSTSSLPFSLVSREVALRREKAKAESLSRFSTTSTISPNPHQPNKPCKLQKRGHPSYPHEKFIPAWRQLWYVDRERARQVVAGRSWKSGLKELELELGNWSKNTSVDGMSRTSSMRTVRSVRSERVARVDRTTKRELDQPALPSMSNAPPSFCHSSVARLRFENGSIKSQRSRSSTHSSTPTLHRARPPTIEVTPPSRNNSVRSVHSKTSDLNKPSWQPLSSNYPKAGIPAAHPSRVDGTSTWSIKEEKAAKNMTSWAAVTEKTG